MKSLKQSRGFTIIELMIASTVLSILLLIASFAIVGLVRQFYKGINQAKTQEVARAISDEIASSIQFSSKAPSEITSDSGDTVAWCIADQRYFFVIGKRLATNPGDPLPPGSNETSSVLRRSGSCSEGNAVPSVNEGVELVGENMRLIDFSIDVTDPANKIYTVVVTVGLGEDDLFCSPTLNNCNNDVTMAEDELEDNRDQLCRSIAGGQFCATARSEVTVVNRL